MCLYVDETITNKFKKGDKITSNDKCEYNQGTYTCHYDSYIMRGEEFASVNEIYPVLHVEWFDKVPDFVPKFRKNQIVTHYLYKTDKKNWFTALVLQNSFINNRNIENFKGKVLKKSSKSNCSWKENEICEFFDARQFELGEPFEPKFRKGDKFTISDNTFDEAFCDSYMLGAKEVVVTWNNNTYDVSKCKKIILID